MTKQIKYFFIRAQSALIGSTVVNFFGTTYIVSGRIVKKIWCIV